MNEILDEINAAKHIEIVVEKEYLFVGSALYTYILTLHKKVSLVCKEKSIDLKFSFLPWFDKIKRTDTPSAEYSLKLECSSLELYELFRLSNIKINKKIATALYGAVLYETKGFTNSNLNGTILAVCSELIKCGAEYKLATESILKRSSLGFLRLKSIMLQNMILLNDAKAAVFVVSNDDLKATATDMQDAKDIIVEAFNLRYVEIVVLLSSDKKNEVIQILNKEI